MKENERERLWKRDRDRFRVRVRKPRDRPPQDDQVSQSLKQKKNTKDSKIEWRSSHLKIIFVHREKASIWYFAMYQVNYHFHNMYYVWRKAKFKYISKTKDILHSYPNIIFYHNYYYFLAHLLLLVSIQTLKSILDSEFKYIKMKWFQA